MVVLCYDIGGTSIRGAFIKSNAEKEGNYEILHSWKLPNPFKSYFSEMIEVFSEFASSPQFTSYEDKSIHPKDIEAVSIGLPGPILEDKLLSAPPLGINKPIDLKEYKDKFGCPVFFGNDMNFSALAELNYGIGKEIKNFYVLTLSTGIGVGIVIDGKVLTGRGYGEFGHDNLWLELGHSIWAGPEAEYGLSLKCICGRTGCWAAISSGSGIEQVYRELSGTDRVYRKLQKASVKGIKFKRKSCEEIFKDAKGDNDFNEDEKKVIALARHANAHGIGNMLNAFPVDAIVVMGGLGLAQFKKIIPSKREIRKYTINPVPNIVRTSLDKDLVGVLGAYVYASQELKGL